MTDIPLDTTLDILLLIFGVILLIMPLFFNGFQNKIEVKDRKGRLLRVDFRGFNMRGKVLIFVCVLSLSCGVWKALRDDNSKNKFNHIQSDMKDTVNRLNEKVDNFKALALKQYKADSAILKKNSTADSAAFIKIQLGLRKKGYGLDKNYNIINNNYDQSSLVKVAPGGYIGVLKMINSGIYYNTSIPKEKH